MLFLDIHDTQWLIRSTLDAAEKVTHALNHIETNAPWDFFAMVHTHHGRIHGHHLSHVNAVKLQVIVPNKAWYSRQMVLVSVIIGQNKRPTGQK